MSQPHATTDTPIPVKRLADSARVLPAIEPATARLSRLLCDSRLEARLAQQFGVTDWRVGQETHAAWQTPGWIDVQRGRANASFGIDLAFYPALASAAAEPDASSDAGLATSLRHAVAAILLDPLFDVLGQLGLDDMKVTGLRCAGPARDGLTLRFVRGAQRFECALGTVDRAWFEPLEAHIARQRVPYARCISEIGVPAWLCVGERALNVRTLNGLRPGDVLLRGARAALRSLLATPQRADDADVFWGVPGAHQLHTRVMLDGNRLVINTDPQMTHDLSRVDAALSGTDTPGAASIDELDLPVRFEIETVTLPLVQLSALRAGYVLELPGTLHDARVRLVSYGQVIGSGELVTVGEHLGVRIVQMSSGHDPV
ncbi:MAG TPA: type III secretion system cytoplasmic ring protein SctQ [Paraburkholderia sp.]|jgi:type III secretion protein Q